MRQGIGTGNRDRVAERLHDVGLVPESATLTLNLIPKSFAMTAQPVSQLSAAVDDPRGMQLAAPGSTEAHYVPCAALVPFPVITHLLGSPFFREAAAGEELVCALAGCLEALVGAEHGHLGANEFKVRDVAFSTSVSAMCSFCIGAVTQGPSATASPPCCEASLSSSTGSASGLSADLNMPATCAESAALHL